MSDLDATVAWNTPGPASGPGYESGEEEFTYPASSLAPASSPPQAPADDKKVNGVVHGSLPLASTEHSAQNAAHQSGDTDSEDEETFVYPGAAGTHQPYTLSPERQGPKDVKDTTASADQMAESATIPPLRTNSPDHERRPLQSLALRGNDDKDPNESESDEDNFVYKGKDAPSATAPLAQPVLSEDPEPSSTGLKKDSHEPVMARGNSLAGSENWDATRSTSNHVSDEQPEQISEPSMPHPRPTHVPSTPAPISIASKSTALPAPPTRSIDWPRLAQLAAAGDLEALKKFFQVTCAPAPAGAGISYTSLANLGRQHDFTKRSSEESSLVTSSSAGAWASLAGGPPALHVAARAGQSPIVQWLIDEAGALPHLTDREGETPLHKAVLGAYTDVVRLLLSKGAQVEVRDADGWTPLHAAASLAVPSQGNHKVGPSEDPVVPLMRLLLEQGANPNARATRGWTPLMTAASHGFTERIRLLAQYNAQPFVRNHAAETALDIAASSGRWSTAQYLASLEQERWAAAQLLARAGEDALTPAHNAGEVSASGPEGGGEAPSSEQGTSLAAGTGAYNPLALHVSVVVALHENQRLDSSLTTLALRGGRARWSHQLSARRGYADRRAPGTMPPGPLAPSKTRPTPIWREDVSLPRRSDPYTLPLARYGDPTPISATPVGEAAHFWLGEWEVDTTDPRVSPDGWTYATSFNDPPEAWMDRPPAAAQRLLEGRGWTDLALSLATGSDNAQPSSEGFVRRRRWVRALRRRLDVSFGDALEAAEVLSSQPAGEDEGAAQSAAAAVVEAAQAAARAAAQAWPNDAYVDRARAMAAAKPVLPTLSSTAAEASDISGTEQALARVTVLTLALEELRAHAFSDQDSTRRTQAEQVLQQLTVLCAQARRDAQLDDAEEDEDGEGRKGKHGGGDGGDDDDDDDDDGEFIYPNSYKDDAASVYTRVVARGSAPVRVSDADMSGPSLFSRGGSRGGEGHEHDAKVRRAADLAGSAEFLRALVPLQSRPEGRAERDADAEAELDTAVDRLGARGPGQNAARTARWQPDPSVLSCPLCARVFTFLYRKHHCRACGRVVCDPCSHQRRMLPAHIVVPAPGEQAGPQLAHAAHRVCSECAQPAAALAWRQALTPMVSP